MIRSLLCSFALLVAYFTVVPAVLFAADCPCKPGQSCKCVNCPCNGGTGNCMCTKSVPFDTLAFFHEPDGTITFSRVVTQQRVIGGTGAQNVVYTVADFKGTLDIYVNGKSVTDAQLQAWTMKTVNAQVYVTDTALYFSGGEAVSGAPAGAPLCPNGKCPLK